MAEAVLVLNAGSSSIKFSVYRLGDRDRLFLDSRGQVEGIGTRPRFVASDGEGVRLRGDDFAITGSDGHGDALRRLGAWLRERLSDDRVLAVGHRVVHGGAAFEAPVAVDEVVLRRLDGLVPLAPLHQPHNLAAIRAVRSEMPGLLQVACFDTAFHRAHPELADRFALPRRYYDEGVRRYGFHGLSYEYIAHRLQEIAPEIAEARVVVAHLGSGASMCAMRAGRSQDSTMGFTALDGLPMGTRCGALDPGVVIHLMRAYGMDADAVERLLYKDCGLKGVSGISNDMRTLLASDDPHAAQAVDLFVWRICRELGALAAALEGLSRAQRSVRARSHSARQFRGPTAPAPSIIAANSRVLWLASDSVSDTPAHSQTPRHSTPGSSWRSTISPMVSQLAMRACHWSAVTSASRWMLAGAINDMNICFRQRWAARCLGPATASGSVSAWRPFG